MIGDNVKAYDFEKRIVYKPEKDLGYAAWVSFFPGRDNKWYIGCIEVSTNSKDTPKMSKEMWYKMILPPGYGADKNYLYDLLLLESCDEMNTWKIISHDKQHGRGASGAFAQAFTEQGRFLRFVWPQYSEDSDTTAIYYVSEDNGFTWIQQAALHDNRFCSYPHRMRTLSDGTLVLVLPITAPFSVERPRTCTNLYADNNMQVNICFSYDQGKTWTVPIQIYGGHTVSETDFVELQSGDLLFINNSIFNSPGRQFVYRTEKGFIPGFYEKVRYYESIVPETICITEDDILIGCMRGPHYAWSDDFGQTWYNLGGIPDEVINWRKAGEKGGDVYQPWIHYLGNGRIACAGHYGGDDPFHKDYCNYIMLHLFNIKTANKTEYAEISVMRDYDSSCDMWLNSYTLTLTSNGEPLAGKELDFWYVKIREPGFDDFKSIPLEEKKKVGGKTITVKTGGNGKAQVKLSELDSITDIYHEIQFVVSSNLDRKDPDYKPIQTCQYEFYTLGRR